MKSDVLFDVMLSVHLAVKGKITTLRQFLVLGALYKQPGSTLPEIKKICIADKSGIDSILRRYIYGGLIRKHNEGIRREDGCTHTYYLTEQGESLMRELEKRAIKEVTAEPEEQS